MNAIASRSKTANIGGEQESGFEQAFSSLAYAYIKDKAPRLIEFVVGFQLVDRNEDNTKAIGVFGFKLGERWLYAPVFFLNGDLKGHELLYIKDQDTFVPMKENWVNYIMAKRPYALGERSPKDVYQLGGLAPNIEQLTWPPEQSKFGSDSVPVLDKEEVAAFLPLIAAGVTKRASFLYCEGGKGQLDMAKVAADPWKAVLAGLNFDLPGLLSTNVQLAKRAFQLTRTNPGIKLAMDKFYGKDFFQKMAVDFRDKYRRECTNIMPGPRIKKAADEPFSLSLLPEEKVAAGPAAKVIVRDEVAMVQNLPDLDEKQRTKLLNDGVLIIDHREGEEVSVSYNTQASPQRLCNPSETTIYDVLERPSEWREMVIISNPYSNQGQHNYVTVVRLEDGNKAWLNAERTSVWTRQADSRDSYKTWFEALPEAKELSKESMYVAISATGQGTVPFVVTKVLGDGSYIVNFKTHADHGSRGPGHRHSYDKTWVDHDGDYVSPYGAKLTINKRQDSSLRAYSEMLHVPETFKFLRLTKPPKPKKETGCCNIMDPIGDSDGYESDTTSDPSPIDPGDMRDIQMMFMQKTSSIKIISDGHEFTVQTEKCGQERGDMFRTLRTLVEGHGLREKQARDMIGKAGPRGSASFRIKYARSPFAETAGPGPDSPAFPGPEYGSEHHGYRTTPAQYPQEEHIPVDGLQSDLTDPSIYDPFLMPDQNAVSLAQQAGQEGRKEVFDVTMLSGMLKTVRQDSLVDRYLGDLMKALDRLGRMLFLFYWHGEEFEDRYGKADLPELEDSIRNAFETLGDVTLFLKEKTIEIGEQDSGTPNIEEAARN